jgi:hypothetical protein
MGKGFVELEPFEHERRASGSRFNLQLESATRGISFSTNQLICWQFRSKPIRMRNWLL